MASRGPLGVQDATDGVEHGVGLGVGLAEPPRGLQVRPEPVEHVAGGGLDALDLGKTDGEHEGPGPVEGLGAQVEHVGEARDQEDHVLVLRTQLELGGLEHVRVRPPDAEHPDERRMGWMLGVRQDRAEVVQAVDGAWSHRFATGGEVHLEGLAVGVAEAHDAGAAEKDPSAASTTRWSQVAWSPDRS
ncbi:MAG: hypothetical protein H6734_15980 [Alphaproteobacteria bacterium]|nr:hypothetical protein [Alphaproteobacteria bacterium]